MAESFYLKMAKGGSGGVYSLARACLAPAAAVFTGVVGLRNALYDGRVLPVRRAGVPVISLGNLTVGGTGKTPATILTARMLLASGRRPGIVSRGYGARAGSDDLSDENRLLRETLPEVPLRQDKDRWRGACRLKEEEGVDCILLDDGFQHRSLHRDMNVLLLDATLPWGGGRLLPAGLLREPLAQCRRASFVLFTRTDMAGEGKVDALAESLLRLGYKGEVGHAVLKPSTVLGPGGRELSWFQDRSVYLFSGVGNPASFRHTVEGLGAQIAGEETFGDHFPYSREDVARLSVQAQRAGAACVFTTVKDWVKIRDLVPQTPPPFNALGVEMKLCSGVDAFSKALDALFPGRV